VATVSVTETELEDKKDELMQITTQNFEGL